MHKIFFGTIVFFSLAFLAACGGGGSGSTGATGAAGADGSAGTIALFEDADLLVTFNGAAGALPGSTPTAVPLDSGAVIGEVDGALVVTGLDNITSADSRKKYYMYSETSTGVKHLLTGQTGTQTETTLNSLYNSQDDGVLDMRLSNAVTATNTLAGWVLASGVGADGVSRTTTYWSVCPGNEAGDGACSKVLAPAYDRGIATTPASVNAVVDTVVASVTYVGGSFQIIADNGTSATAKVRGYRLTAPKSGFASALSSDNTSAIFARVNQDDNNTLASNVITRGSDIWFAYSNDNSTVGPEGDNVSLITRANGTLNFTDNGTIVTALLTTAHAELTTAPQIADAGDGTYVLLGASTTITGWNIRDNGTDATLTSPTAIAVANNWCSASSGVAGAGVVLVSDNSTNGWISDLLLDNGSTTRLAGVTTEVTDDQVATADVGCALTYHVDKFYLAVADVWTGTPDNVSVWSSTDATTWTQIGADFTVDGTVAGLAIGNTGSSSSDTGVWVAVNDGNNVELWHYEDIAGGSTNAWRGVTLITGASTTAYGNGRVSIATDGTSVIAVSAIKAGAATVGFWYNQ